MVVAKSRTWRRLSVVVGGSRGMVAAGEQIEVGLDFVVLIARRGRHRNPRGLWPL